MTQTQTLGYTLSPRNSRSIAELPASQQINHRSRLMSPVTPPCDCPVIIPLIMTIIIIIISLLQFITPDPNEDGIMVQVAVIPFIDWWEVVARCFLL